MKRFIAILGNFPEPDLLSIKQLISRHDIEVELYKELPPGGYFTTENLPIAFMSCFSADPQTLLQLFGVLPIGTGESIPLFQMVSGNGIDPFLTRLPIQGFFESPITDSSMHTILQIILRNELLISQTQRLKNEIIRCRKQKNQLVMIGASLTKEYDLNGLLKIILTVCREMVGADAGSIYVRGRVRPGGAYAPYVTFKVTQNDSVDVGVFNEFSLPIDENSIAGYVAKTARILNIQDVEHIDNLPCKFDRGWEKKIGYRTVSMLTLPLMNIENEVVGVLQLINKRFDTQDYSMHNQNPDLPCAFTLSDEEYVHSIASQAAVSIERAHYHECITALFEGFLSSSIAAIDERDKVTSGHSRRVMEYAIAFADAAKSDPDGKFSSIVSFPDRIRQFQYAALLHDIGKIGVPESVLTKETRLDKAEWNNLQMRFRYIALQMITDPEKVGWSSEKQLEEDLAFVESINKSGYCNDSSMIRLMELAKKQWVGSNGIKLPLFTSDELEKLSIRKGNLTESERISINSHAESTYRILSKIPWTRNLEQVPLIASQHHEKVNGSGYPEGLHGDEILMESKILAVIDIFEALVAQDRPYKPRMPVDKALAILRDDVKNGLLDNDVVEFFIEKRIFERVMDSDKV